MTPWCEVCHAPFSSICLLRHGPVRRRWRLWPVLWAWVRRAI
jgi:hypothetical protein